MAVTDQEYLARMRRVLDAVAMEDRNDMISYALLGVDVIQKDPETGVADVTLLVVPAISCLKFMSAFAAERLGIEQADFLREVRRSFGQHADAY